VAETLQTQHGMAEGLSSPHVDRRCPRSARRRGGRYGSLSALALELGNSHAASPTAVGHENASVRTGGRRRRSSQMPRGNAGDRAKVRQVWCTETAWQTQTWDMFTRGSGSYKRSHGLGRVPAKMSGLKPSHWKARCAEKRPPSLGGGKGLEALPILTGSWYSSEN